MDEQIDRTFIKKVNVPKKWFDSPEDAPKEGMVNVGDIELSMVAQFNAGSFDVRSIFCALDRVEISLIKRF